MTPNQVRQMLLSIVNSAVEQKECGISKKLVQSNTVFSLEQNGVNMVAALDVGEKIIKELYKQENPTALSICQAVFPPRK